jgi:hypothetical protein
MYMPGRESNVTVASGNFRLKLGEDELHDAFFLIISEAGEYE